MWPHYLPLWHHLLSLSLAHSNEAPQISLLFLKHTRCGLTPGPLHWWLCSLPRMYFSLVICMVHSLTSLSLYSNVTSSVRSSLITYLSFPTGTPDPPHHSLLFVFPFHLLSPYVILDNLFTHHGHCLKSLCLPCYNVSSTKIWIFTLLNVACQQWGEQYLLTDVFGLGETNPKGNHNFFGT